MPIDTTRDLFLYELGLARDAENGGRRLIGFMVLQAKGSDVVSILKECQQQNEEHLASVNSCLDALGYSPIDSVSESVEGIYQRFHEFTRLRPSPDMLDQFAVDTAIRFMYVGVAAYKTLLDWAILMAESRCSQTLHANLVGKQDSASKLELFSHEVGVRLLSPA